MYKTTKQLSRSVLTVSLQIMVSLPDVSNIYSNWFNSVILPEKYGETLLKDILNKMVVDIPDGAEIHENLEPNEKLIKNSFFCKETVYILIKLFMQPTWAFSLQTHFIGVRDTQKQYPLMGT